MVQNGARRSSLGGRDRNQEKKDERSEEYWRKKEEQMQKHVEEKQEEATRQEGAAEELESLDLGCDDEKVSRGVKRKAEDERKRIEEEKRSLEINVFRIFS